MQLRQDFLSGQPFFNMAFACCMDVRLVSVHMHSMNLNTAVLKNCHSHDHCLLSKWKRRVSISSGGYSYIRILICATQRMTKTV